MRKRALRGRKGENRLFHALVRACDEAHGFILQAPNVTLDLKRMLEDALWLAAKAGYAKRVVCREGDCIVHGTDESERCHRYLPVGGGE